MVPGNGDRLLRFQKFLRRDVKFHPWTGASAGANSLPSKGTEGAVAKELQLFAVGLVFVFLGAIVVGVF